MKRIVLCADDYGQAPEISKAIIVLLEKNRLTAVSCMTTSADWPVQAAWLQPYHNQVDIGLHFNLTENQAISSAYIKVYGAHFMSLKTLILKAYFTQLDQAALTAECVAQIDQFRAATGYLPRFIDGHQHVHQLPQIRDAVLMAYNNRLRNEGAYQRLAKPRLTWQDVFKAPKKVFIYALGSRQSAKLLNDNKIPHNLSFSGCYGFNINDYRSQFIQFLTEIGPKGIIMCHPGLLPETARVTDAIAKARVIEFDYFLSDSFLADCNAAQVRLVPFKAVF